ncbi:unnamed protein product [Thelazia callipaeda]|uniref:Protein kinase domain-containing protein n=1 Tax=Thelazia callipaeda TaxID=103827 RepID=A0A0N5CYK4_THECL|nr:unnamed protein product [Thelazia callipaeda]
MNKRHFLTLKDRGRVLGYYNYLITTMADINLNDLRKSPQTLQAIHDVHLNHYIHRDIRPDNFLIGFPPKSNIVYMIGFSLLEIKLYRTPRKLTKWQGSNCKFQSRSYHLHSNIARIDDVESWFYMCIDFFGQTLLPWNDITSESEIFLCKQRLFCDGCEEIYNVIPQNFRAIF